MSVFNIVSGHSHSFDTGVACTLGIKAATVFNHILSLRVNNISEGYLDAVVSGYMTEEDLKKSIELLIEHKLIKKVNGRIFLVEGGVV